jgi:histidine triad (HIT) family protein
MAQDEPGKPADEKGSCAFCSMLRGETESYGVFEDEVSAAFLDRRPLFPGHCLLIPKKHYETFAGLPRSVVTPLFVNAQLLAAAVEQAMEAEGTFLAINNRVSQSVPHFHIHIVPRRRKDGLRGFFWPRQPYKDKEAIAAVQTRLRSVISQLVSDRASSART